MTVPDAMSPGRCSLLPGSVEAYRSSPRPRRSSTAPVASRAAVPTPHHGAAAPRASGACGLCRQRRGVCRKRGQPGHLPLGAAGPKVQAGGPPKKQAKVERRDPSTSLHAAAGGGPAPPPPLHANTAISASTRTSKRRRTSQEEVARFRCTYCARDLTATSRIKCAVCEDFNLCDTLLELGNSCAPNSHSLTLVGCARQLRRVLQRGSRDPPTQKRSRLSRRGGSDLRGVRRGQPHFL
jgi:hypothetical protein